MTTQITDTGPIPLVYPDYCATCVRDGCTRMDSVCEPLMSEWPGFPAMVVATYACPCGHTWTCHWHPDFNLDNESEAA